MKKDEIIGFYLAPYNRQETYNIPVLVDNEDKDKLTIKYDEEKSEIITQVMGEALINFLNLDTSNKEETMKYLLDNYSLLAFKGIYESKAKQVFKNEFVNKKEYEEYAKEIMDACYDDVIQAQDFFKDYLAKIYNYNKEKRYADASREMRELLFIKAKTTNLKLYNKYEKYIQTDIQVTNGKEAVKNWPLLTSEISYYLIASDNIIALFYTLLKYLTNYKSISINKCNYCKDYFMPISRSDEKFCSKVYPDGTSCRTLGVRDNWKTVLEEDEVRKLYTNTYQKKLMYCKRNPEDIEAKENFEFWKKEIKQMMKQYKKGIVSKEKIELVILKD